MILGGDAMIWDQRVVGSSREPASAVGYRALSLRPLVEGSWSLQKSHSYKTLSSLAPPRFRFGTTKFGVAEWGTRLFLLMREYLFFVYIMASKSRILYTGITNDLNVRVFQHKLGGLMGSQRSTVFIGWFILNPTVT